MPPMSRRRNMRRILLVFVALAIAFSPAASPAANNHVLRIAGLRLVAPASWHLTREQLTECSSPTQVMAVTDAHAHVGRGAKLPREKTLVLFLEDRGYQGGGFPLRRRFRVHPLERMGGCCEMPISTGFELTFRDQGRNFYAFVYAGKRANAEQAVAVLNTLVVG